MILRSSFRAMSCDVLIDIDGGTHSMLMEARRKVEDLELLWSRFIPSSDISRLNTSSGSAVAVADETLLLVKYMISAFEKTSGLFNPTLIPVLLDLGDPRLGSLPSTPMHVFESLEGIAIEPPFISLPKGMVLDPASIAKGLAADIVAEWAASEGSRGVCVSVGGDLRFIGPPRPIPVLDSSSTPVAHVAVSSGGVATSATSLRALKTGSHILDPRTLSPVSHGVEQVTVLASSAAWAEALATATLVSGSPDLADSLNVAALLLTSSGPVRSAFWTEL